MPWNHLLENKNLDFRNFFFAKHTFFTPNSLFTWTVAPRPGSPGTQKYSDGLKNLLCRKIKVMFREVEIL